MQGFLFEVEKTISVPLVAKKLGCSTQHVRKMCEAGEMEAKQPGRGRHWKIRYSSFVAYLERVSFIAS